MRRRHIGLVIFLLIQALDSGFGQEEPDIQRYLDRIQQGRADEVRAELPSLIASHQRHPGVIFLQGMLTSDGAEAASIFQSVVDNFPSSEWADDALYKVYQFYYSLGLYKTAEEKLAELRRKYPRSEYVTGKKRSRVAAAPSGKPSRVSRPPDRKSPEPVTRPSGARTGSAYSVQVGAFREMKNASSLKNFFKGLGYGAEVRNKVQAGRSLHIVWVGSFATLEGARKISQELRAKYNIDSFVVTR